MTKHFSKVIVAAPILWGLIFLTVDFIMPDFAITQDMVSLIEFMIGSTVIGGTANAGFKRYVNYKNGKKSV